MLALYVNKEMHSNKLYVHNPIMLVATKKDVNTVKHNKLHYNYWLKQTSIATVMEVMN